MKTTYFNAASFQNHIKINSIQLTFNPNNCPEYAPYAEKEYFTPKQCRSKIHLLPLRTHVECAHISSSSALICLLFQQDTLNGAMTKDSAQGTSIPGDIQHDYSVQDIKHSSHSSPFRKHFSLMTAIHVHAARNAVQQSSGRDQSTHRGAQNPSKNRS